MTISLPWWRAARAAAPVASAGLSLHAAAPGMAPPSVEIQGLRLGYRGKPVLQDVDWRLQPGQVVGLLGRNGAGKTTLLETLLGLREAEAGTLRLFGEAPALLSDANRARIGYVPQQSDLFEGLSADELLAYFRSFYPRWNQAKVEQLLARWAVPRDVAIGRLSGGEQQRLSIIRALAHEPELLVLDEPVASLDPLARRDFLRELVETVLDRGCTVVFSTHILSDLERVAFQVAFLQQGRIRLQQPLDELLDELQLLQGDEAQLAPLSRLQGVDCLAKLPGRWLMRGLPGTLPAGLLAQRPTLEDLFEALT